MVEDRDGLLEGVKGREVQRCPHPAGHQKPVTFRDMQRSHVD
jgi:hypothetical protein